MQALICNSGMCGSTGSGTPLCARALRRLATNLITYMRTEMYEEPAFAAIMVQLFEGGCACDCIGFTAPYEPWPLWTEMQAHAQDSTIRWAGTCYLTPLLGAWLADSRWGRYKTILVFSSIYVLVRSSGLWPWNSLSVPCCGRLCRCCPAAGCQHRNGINCGWRFCATGHDAAGWQHNSIPGAA
jgi:hypothetical protein